MVRIRNQTVEKSVTWKPQLRFLREVEIIKQMFREKDILRNQCTVHELEQQILVL